MSGNDTEREKRAEKRALARNYFPQDKLKSGSRKERLPAASFHGVCSLKDSRTDAYFTVEAALIVPVVLCIFILIMYLSFYLYDRCVMAQECYVLSYRQSIEKAGRDRAGDREALERFKSRLFMLSRLETGYSDGSTVKVWANAKMEPPIFGLLSSGTGGDWLIGVQRKARKTDPPKVFRRARRIMNLAGKALPDD